MRLTWMKKYRSLVEKFIRYANTYTHVYNRQAAFGTTTTISPSQIQTLEYIMESENMKMSEIAKRLGVTRGTFSKNVKRLEEKGLLQKFRREGNNKDIYLFATDLGKEIYNQYSAYVYKIWFQHMFTLADQVPEQYLRIFEEMLEGFSEAFIVSTGIEGVLPVYKPLSADTPSGIQKNQS